MQPGRDFWQHEEMQAAKPHCPAEPFDSEHPLFILYTSGSTGKPKGILHTTAGYLLGAKLTTKYFFDLKPEDVYFCTADLRLDHRPQLRGLRRPLQRRAPA